MGWVYIIGGCRGRTLGVELGGDDTLPLHMAGTESLHHSLIVGAFGRTRLALPGGSSILFHSSHPMLAVEPSTARPSSSKNGYQGQGFRTVMGR